MVPPFAFVAYAEGNPKVEIEVIFGNNVCAWCTQPPPDGDALKRCRGCNTTVNVYCGRVCQAAAWRLHRALCRTRHSEAGSQLSRQSAGYATAVALGQALKEWVGIHKYSLSVLAHSMLRRSGGVDANLQLAHVVAFRLNVSSKHAESAPAAEDPATAFRLRVAQLHPDPVLCGAALESLKPRDIESAARESFRGDSVNTASTGFIPAMFLVEGTNFAMVAQCAVYRASRHPDDAPLDEEMVAACRDIDTLFMAFVNDGIMVQPPANPEDPPDVGRMAKARKTWKFEPEDDAWGTDLETSPALRFWTRFRQW